MYDILSENPRKEFPNVVPFSYQSPYDHLFFTSPCVTCRLLRTHYVYYLEIRQLTVESRAVAPLDTRIGVITLNDEIALKLHRSPSWDYNNGISLGEHILRCK